MLLFLSILVAFGAGIVAAIMDIARRRIPNAAVVAIMTCFALACAVSEEAFTPLWPHIAAAAGVLAAGYGLFILGRAGAGDAKLAAAWALWMGGDGLAAFLLMTALFGGVTAVIGYWRGWKTMPWAPAMTLAAMFLICRALWA